MNAMPANDVTRPHSGAARETMDVYSSRRADRPKLAARQDATVYREWTPDAPVSKAQATTYSRNGFVVLSNLFHDDEMRAICDEARCLRQSPGNLDPQTVIAEPDSGAVRSVFEVHTQSSVFGRLVEDVRLVRIAQFLLNDDVYIHQTRMNYKPGFQGKEFYWHSDFETWHVEDGMPRMRALSVTVLLSENTPYNGPLMLIPGSHHHFVSCVGETPDEHYKKSLRRQEYGVPDEESLTKLAEQGGIDAATGPVGTVVLFDCNTMHGSASNITPFPRSNAFIVYNAQSNRLEAPFGPATPRPDFIAARENTAAIQPLAGKLVGDAA